MSQEHKGLIDVRKGRRGTQAESQGKLLGNWREAIKTAGGDPARQATSPS